MLQGINLSGENMMRRIIPLEDRILFDAAIAANVVAVAAHVGVMHASNVLLVSDGTDHHAAISNLPADHQADLLIVGYDSRNDLPNNNHSNLQNDVSHTDTSHINAQDGHNPTDVHLATINAEQANLETAISNILKQSGVADPANMQNSHDVWMHEIVKSIESAAKLNGGAFHVYAYMNDTNILSFKGDWSLGNSHQISIDVLHPDSTHHSSWDQASAIFSDFNSKLNNTPNSPSEASSHHSSSPIFDSIVGSTDHHAVPNLILVTNSDNANFNNGHLNIPEGVKVLHAELYWNSDSQTGHLANTHTNSSVENPMLFVPGSMDAKALVDLHSSQQVVDNTGVHDQVRVDITNLVQSAGLGNYQLVGLGDHGINLSSWGIAIAYTNPNLPANALPVYDGFLNTHSNANYQTLAVVPNATAKTDVTTNSVAVAPTAVVTTDAGTNSASNNDAPKISLLAAAVTGPSGDPDSPHVNHQPSFTIGPNEIVSENTGLNTITHWATNINQGNEDPVQLLTFVVTNNTNSALFSTQPAVSPIGTLTFTPAPDAFGTATITVVLKDNGGTANGGVDTSTAQTFTITISPVNDAPSFTIANNPPASLEDGGLQTVNNFATNISAGPNETQNVHFEVVNNSNPSLFSVAPTINPDGTLSYQAATDVSGTATVTVVLKDDGGTDNGGHDTSMVQTFTINIEPVNQAPSFTIANSPLTLENSGTHTINNFASDISAGPPNESTQTVNFTVTNDNPSLFSAQPSISADGTLTYTLAQNTSGIAHVNVVAIDNGGTENGGVNSSQVQSFAINVVEVNQPPSFVDGSNQTVSANSGSHTVSHFISTFSAGPPNEANQTISFIVSTNNTSLFSVQPTIAPDGTLSYTLAQNASGVAVVNVQIVDNGGTANGGVDISQPQHFTINVIPVNTPTPVTSTSGSAAVGSAESTSNNVALTPVESHSVSAAVQSTISEDAGIGIHRSHVPIVLPEQSVISKPFEEIYPNSQIVFAPLHPTSAIFHPEPVHYTTLFDFLLSEERINNSTEIHHAALHPHMNEENYILTSLETTVNETTRFYGSMAAIAAVSFLGLQDMNAIRLDRHNAYIFPVIFYYINAKVEVVGNPVTWNGSELKLQVSLKSIPTAKVRAVVKSSDEKLGTIKPAVLEFTESNWYIPQEITVHGHGGIPGSIVNGEVEGGESYKIIFEPLESSDANYRKLEIEPIQLWGFDNPTH